MKILPKTQTCMTDKGRLFNYLSILLTNDKIGISNSRILLKSNQ